MYVLAVGDVISYMHPIFFFPLHVEMNANYKYVLDKLVIFMHSSLVQQLHFFNLILISQVNQLKS